MEKVDRNSNVIGNFTLKNAPHKTLVLILLLGMLSVFVLIGLSNYMNRLGLLEIILVCLVSAVAVTIPHEGLHGIFMWKFGGKVSFGAKWTKLGPAAYATSPAYFTKTQYRIISLAPQILTIVMLLIALLAKPSAIVGASCIIIAALNLGGGCLDIYMFWWVRRFPDNSFFKDNIDGVEVYAQEEVN
jgi:hypothetical protein